MFYLNLKTLKLFHLNLKDFNNISFKSYVAFGTGESTLLLTTKFLEMWFLAIWMFRNVIIPMFGFIGNLIRFLEMWDNNIWFISKNFKWKEREESIFPKQGGLATWPRDWAESRVQAASWRPSQPGTFVL